MELKIAFFIIVISVSNVFATPVYSQVAKVSLNMENKSLEQVMDEIESQSEFYFIFNQKQIDVNRVVSINAENELITDILPELFTGTNVNYAILDRKILLTTDPLDNNLLATTSLTEQQQNRVTGTVTDKNGPIPGANVVVTGTTQGTLTDIAGKYSIEVPQGSKSLTFSFVGMEPQETTIGTLTQINVTMVESAIGLEEVVVIGYGTAKRSEVTGSVGYASGKELKVQPSFNALEQLRGKVAGVNIFTNSGSPTGDNKVLIRGLGTINASSAPLYVVDGVQMSDIVYLNPNIIKSIEVLKDASSAAIYGARGANGVILITTEKGLSREGITVDFQSQFSIGRIAKKPNSKFRPMNSEEFMAVQRQCFENAIYFNDYAPGTEPVLMLNNDLLFDSQGNPKYDTNWEKEATRTAFSHDQQLNIKSGTKNSSTGLFLNYSDKQGIFLRSYATRANAKFVYDVKPVKWLSVGVNGMVTSVNENTPDIVSAGNSVSRAIEGTPPIFPVKWADGTWTDPSQAAGINMQLLEYSNPVSILEDEDRLNDRTILFGKFYVGLQINPNLDLRSEVAINKQLYRYQYYGPTYLKQHGYPEGQAVIQNSQEKYWQNENYLNYDKSVGKHHIKAMLGASVEQNTSEYSSLNARKFKDNFYKYNYLGVSEKYDHPSSDYTDWSMNSYFGRGTYTYDEKYTLTLTGRYDGSSRFGANNKYGFFPSGGISWFVSKENFMSGIKFIDQLRLRLSYGATGNTGIGLYRSLATISSGTTLIGGALQSTSYRSRLDNPDLRWERSYQTDVGMEGRFFNNVLSLDIDYYYKLTRDLLLDRPIPSTTGFETITDNIGEISNRGVDVQITTQNISTSKFMWTSALSFNYNKNKIEKLGENNEDIFPGPNWVEGSQTILRVGESAGSFWGYERLGTWAIGEEAEAAAVGSIVGMAKRSEHQQIIGKGFPDIIGSFINHINIGNFDLAMDLQFSFGAELLNQATIVFEDRFGLSNGYKTQLYESWTPNNQNTMVPRIRSTQLSGQDLHIDTREVQHASYVRGNLFTFGYTFDKNLLNKLGLAYLRVGASFENAFLICSKDFQGYDPEASGGGGDSANFGQNIFFNQYPKPRTFSLMLNVTF